MKRLLIPPRDEKTLTETIINLLKAEVGFEY
jgi:hypothetical protein